MVRPTPCSPGRPRPAPATWSSPGCFATIAPSTFSTPAAALAETDRPLPPSAVPPLPNAATAIDARTAARIIAESPALRQLGGAGGALLPEELSAILDAQARQLRGTLLRLAGQPAPS